MNTTLSDKEGQQENKDTADETPLLLLSEIAADVYRLIEENPLMTVHGINADLHALPPYVPKSVWQQLGRALQGVEEIPLTSISGDYWISLRCDGNNFRKLKKKLAALGVLPHRWSQEPLAQIMVKCCHALMEFCNAKVGYTQSDEITVLVAPTVTNPDNGGNTSSHCQRPHKHGGRTQKLVSLAAATVSTVFNLELVKLYRAQNLLLLPEDNDVVMEEMSGRPAIFDCRIASYATRDEAAALLLWRAYDCGINGVSDAIYTAVNDEIDGASTMVPCSTTEKLAWLAAQGRLPLPRHQQMGVYLAKYRKVCETVNATTGQMVQCIRAGRHVVEGNLIHLWKQGRLFPSDETLE